MNFTFKGRLPRLFTAMSQKSIAISSLFGPQATRVNNAVTSGRAADLVTKQPRHGKTASRSCLHSPVTAWALRGPASGRAIQRGQPPPSATQNRTRGLNEKAALHPPALPAPMMWVLWKDNEKSYFLRLLKLRREIRDQICHFCITFLERLIKSPSL